MESMYQLPPLFAYPPLPSSNIPMFDAPDPMSLYGHLPPTSSEQFLYGNPLLDGNLQKSTFQPDYTHLDAAFGGLPLNLPSQTYLPQMPPLPRKPLVDDTLNVPRPFCPQMPVKLWCYDQKRSIGKKIDLSEDPIFYPEYMHTFQYGKTHMQEQYPPGNLDPLNWRIRATEDLQNVAPEKNSVRKTIYVTDVDQQITEEQLAVFFKSCGDVLDCRVCGDPNSAMRFAFVEFATERSASQVLNITYLKVYVNFVPEYVSSRLPLLNSKHLQALHLNGTVLGDYALRVLPSKTAIVPVNTQYLPKTTTEREKCSRTVYAANIDKKVDRESVKLFFETICGTVSKIRLLGDWQHSTRIAFVEFLNAESAKLALGCSGALLGLHLILKAKANTMSYRETCPAVPLFCKCSRIHPHPTLLQDQANGRTGQTGNTSKG